MRDADASPYSSRFQAQHTCSAASSNSSPAQVKKRKDLPGAHSWTLNVDGCGSSSDPRSMLSIRDDSVPRNSSPVMLWEKSVCIEGSMSTEPKENRKLQWQVSPCCQR